MPTRQSHILVVDDDAGIRNLISDYLQREGYLVSTAEDAVSMDRLLAVDTPPIDLMVLDVMMPGEQGLDITRRLSTKKAVPIIILSAMGEDDDRITGLELGADDYLAKPCNPRELLARIKAVLRRHDKDVMVGRSGVRFAGWKLDWVKRELTSPATVLVTLSDTELSLLRTFVEHAREDLSRETLLEHNRQRGLDSGDRAIDVQISRLRRKLQSAAPEGGVELISTVRNLGYRFNAEVARL